MSAQGLARRERRRDRFRKSPSDFPRVDQRPKIAEQSGEKAQTNPKRDVYARRRWIQRGPFRTEQRADNDVYCQQH